MRLFRGQLVESLFQDDLYGPIPGVVDSPGPDLQAASRRFSPNRFPREMIPCAARRLSSTRSANRASMSPLQWGPMRPACLQAPLGVSHLVGQGLGGQVVVDGGALAGFSQPGMDGHQFEVVEDLHDGLGGLQPQHLLTSGKGPSRRPSRTGHGSCHEA